VTGFSASPGSGSAAQGERRPDGDTGASQRSAAARRATRGSAGLAALGSLEGPGDQSLPLEVRDSVRRAAAVAGTPCILALLPAPAPGTARRQGQGADARFYVFAGEAMRVVDGYSSEVTTEEARALAAAPDDAGIKRGTRRRVCAGVLGQGPG